MIQRILAGVLILCVIVICFCGCQPSEETNDSFTVTYVIRRDYFSEDPADNWIQGKYRDQVEVTAIDKAFKDCSLEGFEYIDGKDVKLSEGDGVYIINGGLRLTLKDSGGSTHVVDVAEGSVFSFEETDGDVYLLLPDEN